MVCSGNRVYLRRDLRRQAQPGRNQSRQQNAFAIPRRLRQPAVYGIQGCSSCFTVPAYGGEDGAPGRASITDPAAKLETDLPGKCPRRVSAGTILRIETPGGNGWGAT
jgi:N-methylhydantoinase B/oxoprolinase/acetone carboxylase alpha subunit